MIFFIVAKLGHNELMQRWTLKNSVQNGFYLCNYAVFQFRFLTTVGSVEKSFI